MRTTGDEVCLTKTHLAQMFQYIGKFPVFHVSKHNPTPPTERDVVHVRVFMLRLINIVVYFIIDIAVL